MDQLVRMTAQGAPLRAMAITGRALVERAREIHHTTPVATAALGRLLMAASMMGARLKEEDGSVTLRLRGGGPLGTALAVSDSGGNVRGYVENPGLVFPPKYPGKLDVGGAVGREGYLTVIQDLHLKEPYVGMVSLVSGEIAEDITAYFAESEQMPTACALGVLVAPDGTVQTAGGYLIQLLPGAGEEVIAQVEAGIRATGAVTAALEQGLDAEGLLRQVLAGFSLETLETQPVAYRCHCSRARMRQALLSLRSEELDEMMAEGQAELTCQFCDSVQRFSRDELAEICREKQAAAPASQEENEKS